MLSKKSYARYYSFTENCVHFHFLVEIAVLLYYPLTTSTRLVKGDSFTLQLFLIILLHDSTSKLSIIGE